MNDTPSKTYALTRGQHLIWLGMQRSAEQAPYEMEMLFSFDADVDPARFRRAWERTVASIEALRTTFRSDGVAQVWHETSGVFDVLEVDHADPRDWLRTTPGPRLDAETRPFVSLLIRTTDQRWHWYFAQHHLICDAQSTRLVFRHLADRYAGRVDAANSSTDFSRYATTLRASRESERARKARDHFTNLSGALDGETYEIYGFSPNPSGTAARRLTYTPSAAVAARWVEFRSANTTFSPALTELRMIVTAFLALTYRTGRMPSVGIAHGNRGTAASRAAVGLCMDIFPLHVPIDGAAGMSELFERVGVELIEQLKHAAPGVMTPELARRNHCVVNYLSIAFGSFDDRPVAVDLLAPRAGEPHQLVNLQINRFDEHDVSVHFDFAADVLTPHLEACFVQGYGYVVDALLDRRETSIDELVLMGDGHRQRCLESLVGPAPAWGDDAPLHERVARFARNAPERPAVVAGERRVSYRELDQLADGYARVIRTRARDEAPRRIGLHLRMDVDMLGAMLGTLKAGAAYVPIDPELPSARIRDIADQAELDLVVSGNPTAVETSAPVVRPGVAYDAPVSESLEHLQADWDQPAYTLFTSGSTGRPKGVTCTHRNVLNLLEDFEGRAPLAEGARCSIWTNPGFDVSVYEIFSALAYGRTLYIVPDEIRLEAEGIHAWLKAHEIDSTYLPPFLLHGFSARCERDGLALHRMLVGLEPIPEALLSTLVRSNPGLRLINGYGPTETTICATLYDVGDQPRHAQTPIGRPVRRTRIYLLDRRLHPVPQGAIGEICVAGEGVGAGYLNPPDDENPFVPDPFAGQGRMYRTGDQARLLDDGNLEFRKRKDDQMKVRGYRIEPGEIEAALRAVNPDVADVVVRLREGAHQPILTAYVVGHTPDEWKPERWYALLREMLPAYMIPTAYVSVATLPVTASGKIDEKALPAPRVARPAAASAVGLSGAHRALLDAFEAVFAVQPLAPDSNFFELGGDSLRAVQIANHAREAGYEVSARQIFESGSIALLATLAFQVPPPGSTPSAEAAQRGPVATGGSGTVRVAADLDETELHDLLRKYQGPDP